MPMTAFRSHSQKTGGRWVTVRPLGPSGRAARFGDLPPEPSPAIEEEEAATAVALNKTGRSKGEAAKVHIGFRLAADVVESLKASGPGYNVRVEEALRQAGFGAKASAAKKRATR
jgi:uncharacterized protein (DUF4415 family)